LAILLDRFVKALLRCAYPAKKHQAQRIKPIEFDGLQALLGGLFVVFLLTQGIRPGAQSILTVLGALLLPQLVGLAVLLDRFVKALLLHAHLAETAVGVGVFPIDADGLLALIGGLVVVPLQAQGVRPVAQSVLTVLGRLCLPQLVGLAVLLDRFVKALLLHAHPAETVVGV